MFICLACAKANNLIGISQAIGPCGVCASPRAARFDIPSSMLPKAPLVNSSSPGGRDELILGGSSPSAPSQDQNETEDMVTDAARIVEEMFDLARRRRLATQERDERAMAILASKALHCLEATPDYLYPIIVSDLILALEEASHQLALVSRKSKK